MSEGAGFLWKPFAIDDLVRRLCESSRERTSNPAAR